MRSKPMQQLKLGRDFTREDVVEARRVAIVDTRIAQQLWPGDPIGQQLMIGQGRQPIMFEVVGVTNPVRAVSVRDATTPHIFVPFEQFGLGIALVVKTDERAMVIGPAIKHHVEALGTRRPVFDIMPMRAYVDRSLGETHFTMSVIVAFAVAALVLAAVGIFGTLTYLAGQRRQEFAVRMVLGASAAQILRGVLGEGLLLAGAGAAAGFAGATAAGPMLNNLLYDVTPADGATLLVVVMLIATIAILATLQPAWRASRIDPAAVLRAE
jgi:hypothetical protein